MELFTHSNLPLDDSMPAPDPIIAGFQGEYRFLSNFWYAAVEFDGEMYRTTEHAYQAAKTLDTEARREIRGLQTAKESKRAGSTVELRPDWEEVKESVMWHILNQKFRIPNLREKLLTTDDTPIVEANHWHDIFWGSCTCEKHKGEGKNTLGRMLMQIRSDVSTGVDAPWSEWGK